MQSKSLPQLNIPVSMGTLTGPPFGHSSNPRQYLSPCESHRPGGQIRTGESNSDDDNLG